MTLYAGKQAYEGASMQCSGGCPSNLARTQKRCSTLARCRQRESRSSTYLLDMVCKGVLVAAVCCQRILQAVLRGSRNVRAQLHSWAEGSNRGAATGMLLL